MTSRQAHAEQADEAIRQAVDAVRRAHEILRASPDPLLAAVDSAMSCACVLLCLRAQAHRGDQADLHALREALAIARALVGEVTFAVRDRYGARPVDRGPAPWTR